MYYCQYGPWNRLEKVRARLDDVTIQPAEYDRYDRHAARAAVPLATRNYSARRHGGILQSQPAQPASKAGGWRR